MVPPHSVETLSGCTPGRLGRRERIDVAFSAVAVEDWFLHFRDVALSGCTPVLCPSS